MTHELRPLRDLEPAVADILPRQKPKAALLVEAFFSGRNPRTLKIYRQNLEGFRAFVGRETLEEAVAHLLSQDQLEANALALAYKQHLQERKLAPATLNNHLAALRSLTKLARTLGVVPWSLEVESLKVEPYRDTRGPGRDGVRELLKVLEGQKGIKPARDRALVRLLYDLALRAFEAVSLDLEHVDLKASALWVQGKGRSQRQRLTLPPKTKETLAAWLKERGQEPGPLFISLDSVSWGKRLSTTGLYLVIRDLGNKAGIRARPHGLRHAAITEALDATRGDVRAVQRFSRHKSLNVLVVYDDARQDLAGEVSRLVSKST